MLSVTAVQESSELSLYRPCGSVRTTLSWHKGMWYTYTNIRPRISHALGTFSFLLRFSCS